MGSEGWPKGSHLVQNTAKRPHIALEIVRLVLPYFWTGIVGSACLGASKIFFEYLGDVKVS